MLRRKQGRTEMYSIYCSQDTHIRLTKIKKELETKTGKKVSYDLILKNMLSDRHTEFQVRKLKRKIVIEEMDSPIHM